MVSFTIAAELKSILKLVLVLSHGQASIERGFNLNETILKVNMNEKSVIAREIIIDHMQTNNLNPASHNYKKTDHLSQSSPPKIPRRSRGREKEWERERAKWSTKILKAEIGDVEKKKECLSQVCESLDKEFVEIIQRAKRKDDTTIHISAIKASGLKQKSMEKRHEIGILEKTVLNLELKKQKLSHK